MAWSSIPQQTAKLEKQQLQQQYQDSLVEKQAHRPAYHNAMEKSQQWRSARSRRLSSPTPYQQRPLVRGKRSLVILTTLLLLVVGTITTLTVRPHYTQTATEYISKWRENQGKLLGHWSYYEEQHFPTTNPTVVLGAAGDLKEEYPAPEDVKLTQATFDPEEGSSSKKKATVDTSSSEPTENAIEDNKALKGVASHADEKPAAKPVLRDIRVAGGVVSE